MPNTPVLDTIEFPDGTQYLLGGSGSSSADQVTYDGTTSGLQATNVQNAIDEVNANVTATDNPLYHLGFYLDANGGLCQVNSI